MSFGKELPERAGQSDEIRVRGRLLGQVKSRVARLGVVAFTPRLVGDAMFETVNFDSSVPPQKRKRSGFSAPLSNCKSGALATQIRPCDSWCDFVSYFWNFYRFWLFVVSITCVLSLRYGRTSPPLRTK